MNVCLDSGAARDNIGRSARRYLGLIDVAVFPEIGDIGRRLFVVDERRRSEVNVVVAAEHHVNRKLRHKNGELLSDCADVLVLVMRALRVRCLVQRDKLPLRIAVFHVCLEPLNLLF